VLAFKLQTRTLTKFAKTSSPMQITTLDDLCNILGQNFVIFCGSAVSGAFVPMVQPALLEFFQELAILLHDGNHYERTIAEYARLFLNKEHKYYALLKQTKFEEFIQRLENTLGEEHVKSFLTALYYCEQDQFNANHDAISFLLQKHIAIACFTTNFDNAIERASGLLPYVRPAHPNRLDNEISLIKLHGDVVSRTYVATTYSLYTAETDKHYEYLESLVANATVLVTGYSGMGDIDIAPHLSNAATAGTRLIWTVWDQSPPSFASFSVKYDLQSQSPDDNWLLGLAYYYGWRHKSNHNGPDWKERLRRWLSTVPLDLVRDMVAQMFYGVAGWPTLHLDYMGEWENEKRAVLPDVIPELGRAHAFLGVADYISAERTLNQASVADEYKLSFNTWKGFIQWRLGYCAEALSTLRPVAEKPLPRDSLREARAIAEGSRFYLETARDMLRRSKNTGAAESFYQKWFLKAVIEKLKQPQINIRSKLLSELVTYDIDYLRGKSVNIEQLYRLFDRCLSLQLWDAAEAVARVLVTVEYTTGIEAFRKIDNKFLENRFKWYQHNWHPLRKRLAARIYSATKCSFLFDLLDGSSYLIKLSAKWIGYISKRRINKWYAAYMKKEIVCQ